MKRFGWELMGIGALILFVGCALVTSPWAFLLALGGAVFGAGVMCHRIGRTLRR